MSVLTRKRLFLTVVASLLVTTALLANPSPRTQARMVFDPATGNTILFGGISPFDNGTQTSYETNETWLWNGARWTQRRPAHAPSPRASHMMVFDTARSRVVLFGGRIGTIANIVDYADTWIYQNNDWTKLEPATSPSARSIAGMAYDSARDRIVLFGGSRAGTDGKTVTAIHDTWEFDGTNWRQIAADGPKVIKPILTYDAVRKQTIMMGVDEKLATQMYTYDAAAGTWTQIKPEGMPPCANEAALTAREDGSLVLVGGACAGTYNEAYFFDGTKWAALPQKTGLGLLFGAALAYDTWRNVTIVYGGAEVGDDPRAFTVTHDGVDWRFRFENVRPAPRSLGTFITDPVNKVVWLFGGLDQHESGYLDDFWRYQNNQWSRITYPDETGPNDCGGSGGAFDTDRNKLIIMCGGATVFEMDAVTFEWKKITPPGSDVPDTRRFAHIVYDPTLKRTVMYGGFAGFQYQNDTWLWDGTTWTEVKKNRADARALAAMWYDTRLKKVVLYGGLGRPDPEDAVRRYTDMWSFEGATNGWKKMTVATVPGERFGSQVVVDPRTGNVLLLGGLKIEPVGEKGRRQVYANDVWEWNGTTWREVAKTTNITARENGMMAWDPSAENFVVFGGYNGFFFNDHWTSDDAVTWTPYIESIGRKRAVGR